MFLAAAQPAAIVTPAPSGAAWTPSAIATLRHDLDALLANAPGLRRAHVGVLALDATTGATLYARAANEEFQPASTLKLLVGSSALDRLGPDYRFVTSAILRTGPEGDYAQALLIAGGDPFLDVPALDDAVSALRSTGVIPRLGWQIDASRFDAAQYPDGWTWDDFGEDYAPPLSAMTFEENVVHLTITPGANVGDPPGVSAAPLPYVAPIERTCDSYSPVVVDATTGPPGSESTLDVSRAPHACTRIVGSIARGAPAESIDAAVVSPVDYVRAYLGAASERAGLGQEHGGPAGPPAAQPSKTFWTHASAPMRHWLGPRFWIPSDNLVAELLLKELGFVVGGKPGTTEKGTAFEKSWLTSIGVDPATVTLADGSGLSQYDRITPRDLTAILAHDWAGPNRDLILASLPVGGARGTIEGIAGTDAAGRVFAKTGSMSHVRGLAGYLAPLHHGAVIFAFNVDDWIGDYKALAAARAAALSRLIDD